MWPSELLTFGKNESLGVVDLRSIGYYQLKMSTIQHYVLYYNEITPLQALCEEFYMLTNTLKAEKQ